MTLSQLRHQHPIFSYESYQANVTPAGLELKFHFHLEPDIDFHPQVTIQGVTSELWTALPAQLRENWLFHLGLAEIPSYWKAAASPEILIKAGQLSLEQLSFWQDLLIQGMGEYFYTNQIDFTPQDFVSWEVAPSAPALTKPSLEQSTPVPRNSSNHSTPSYLIPIGGGKDSSLSLCLLTREGIEHDVLMLNPTPAMSQVAQIATPQNKFICQRVIDPKLLELNQAGYLNGHTPFSSYLGFLSRLVATIFGHQSVLISNERSSNEGNVLFQGKTINHQYSKTYEFERKFNQYLKKSGLVPGSTSPVPGSTPLVSGSTPLVPGSTSTPAQPPTPAYFSFLRPLYELQISRLFITCPDFDKYALTFRSCNRGQKTNTWCGECPKCLFSFVSFYPFIQEEKLIQIFGQNLFEKESLLDEALALLGKTETKPFECVGTHEESIAAFYLSMQKAKQHHDQLPILLQQVWERVLQNQPDLQKRAQKVLSAWNSKHQLPPELLNVLKSLIT